jgi:Arc/MetJ-type ribon-helix-helix transcriptional regulator
MTITLPPDLEEIVTRLVRNGTYPDPFTVIQVALYKLDNEHDELDSDPEELRRAIKKGIESLDRGQGVPLDDAEVARIKASGRALRAAREKG